MQDHPLMRRQSWSARRQDQKKRQRLAALHSLVRGS
jgi:hypothetical protein